MHSEKFVINVAKEFSIMPVGRYYSDGEGSGQAFREEILSPKIKNGQMVEVNINGLVALGSSFMEEAFGGLIRADGISIEKIRELLSITPVDDDYATEIWEYIEDANSVEKAKNNA